VRQYTYDALGNCVAVVEDGALTRFVNCPFSVGTVVGAYDGAGNVTARYGYGLDSSLVMATTVRLYLEQ